MRGTILGLAAILVLVLFGSSTFGCGSGFSSADPDLSGAQDAEPDARLGVLAPEAGHAKDGSDPLDVGPAVSKDVVDPAEGEAEPDANTSPDAASPTDASSKVDASEGEDSSADREGPPADATPDRTISPNDGSVQPDVGPDAASHDASALDVTVYPDVVVTDAWYCRIDPDGAVDPNSALVGLCPTDPNTYGTGPEAVLDGSATAFSPQGSYCLSEPEAVYIQCPIGQVYCWDVTGQYNCACTSPGQTCGCNPTTCPNGCCQGGRCTSESSQCVGWGMGGMSCSAYPTCSVTCDVNTGLCQ